jgi:transcriptional regulator with GAF, ATPase, and Fis domain
MDHPSAQVPPEPPQPANVANVHELSQAAHEELRSNNERLKLLLDLNNAIVSNLELRDLLRAISASVRQVMKCDSVGVALPRDRPTGSFASVNPLRWTHGNSIGQSQPHRGSLMPRPAARQPIYRG